MAIGVCGVQGRVAVWVVRTVPLVAVTRLNREAAMVRRVACCVLVAKRPTDTLLLVVCPGCRLLLLRQYFLTFPSVYAHSLLIGTLRMEMGDAARIVCPKTGFSAEIDFHMKVTGATSPASLSLPCVS